MWNKSWVFTWNYVLNKLCSSAFVTFYLEIFFLLFRNAFIFILLNLDQLYNFFCHHDLWTVESLHHISGKVGCGHSLTNIQKSKAIYHLMILLYQFCRYTVLKVPQLWMAIAMQLKGGKWVWGPSKSLHVSVIVVYRGDGPIGSEQTVGTVAELWPPTWHDSGIINMSRRRNWYNMVVCKRSNKPRKQSVE